MYIYCLKVITYTFISYKLKVSNYNFKVFYFYGVKVITYNLKVLIHNFKVIT